MIIAIDFDDTITEPSKYPVTGKIRNDAITYIQKLYDDGHKLILWTCRTGYNLVEAINLLTDSKIIHCFSTVNANIDEKRYDNCRKVFADFYIDDKSMKIDWKKIYKQISGKSMNSVLNTLKLNWQGYFKGFPSI